jgi:hypothetical protein
LDSFLSKSVNTLQNQAKRAPFDIYSLFNHLSVLGGAPGSVPEPIHPLLLPLILRFLPKRAANPPIETTKDHEKRNNSLNSRSMKMRFFGQIALNLPHRMNLLQPYLDAKRARYSLILLKRALFAPFLKIITTNFTPIRLNKPLLETLNSL